MQLANTILEKFQKTPLFQTFLRDEAAATQAERRRLATRRAELLASAAAATAAIDEQFQAAGKRRDEAKAKCDKAQAAIAKLACDKRNVQARAEAEQQLLERELRRLADPRIAVALEDLNTQAAQLMVADIRVNDVITGRDPQTRRLVVEQHTNERGRRAVLGAIQAARHRLNDLPFEGADDVPGVIETILGAIPWGHLEKLDGPKQAAAA